MNHCAVPKTWTMQCWLLGMILTILDKNTGLSKTGRNIYISVNRFNSQCLWLEYYRCGVKHHIIIQSINQFHIIIEILYVLPQCCINCKVLLSSQIKKVIRLAFELSFISPKGGSFNLKRLQCQVYFLPKFIKSTIIFCIAVPWKPH